MYKVAYIYWSINRLIYRHSESRDYINERVNIVLFVVVVVVSLIEIKCRSKY